MIRLRINLFAAILFAIGSLGFPGALAAQASDASGGSQIAAADPDAKSNEKEVLRTVLQTRDEVRALRREVDSLRKILESTAGKSGSNLPPERGDDARRSEPLPINGVCFFKAEWCGPCREMRPVVERLRQEGLTIVDVDADERRDLRYAFHVDKLPTWVLLIGSQERDRATGVLTEERLRSLFSKIPSRLRTSKTTKPAQQAAAHEKTDLNSVAAKEAAAYEKAKSSHDPPSNRLDESPIANRQPEREGERIDWIMVKGNVTIPTAAILQKLKTQAGDNATPAQIQEDIRTLLRTRWFFTVEAKYLRSDKGDRVLVLAVVERPLVRSVEYQGASEIQSKKLAVETGLKVGTPYEMSTNKDAAKRLEAFYHANGYPEATVDLVSGDKPEQRDIAFRIHEGVAQKVVWRYFEGNTSVSGERLAKELKCTPAAVWIGGKFDPANLAEDVAADHKFSHLWIGGKFDPAKQAEDVAAVRKYYENLGFLDARITPTVEYSKNRRWVFLRYNVQEGPQYRIRKISLIGNTHFKAEELLAAIKTHEGQVYNAFTIKEDIEAIRKKYELSQFMALTAAVAPQHLEQPGSIDLVVRINEGKPHDVRAYPVADLVLPLPGGPTTNVRINFEKLIGLVTDTIEPKTWQKAGGGGSITHYEKTLSLIVRQTPAVQRRISALLRSLRSLQDWQVCLELSFLKNPPADLLQGLSPSAPPESNQGVFPLTDEQRQTLLAAVGQNPNSKVLAMNATMFYGTHGAIGFAQRENQTINVRIADSTDRYAVNLHLELHDNKTGKAASEPVTVTIPNLKTVVIEFKPIGGEASARPSLLVVRPRLLFPLEEEEVKQ